jgi:hypothetical protein
MAKQHRMRKQCAAAISLHNKAAQAQRAPACWLTISIHVQDICMIGCRGTASPQSLCGAAAGANILVHTCCSPPPSSASSCCCQAGSNTPAAVAALSRWARACCNQAQPQVTLSPLVKALLEVWVRFQGGCLLICQPRSVMHMPYTKCICHLYQTHTFKHHCVGVTQFGGRSPVTPPSANAGYIDPMRCCCKFCVCVALMDHCIGTHDAHGRCC